MQVMKAPPAGTKVFVKCRGSNEKRFSFLKVNDGGTTYWTTHLRIHAAMFGYERAVELVATLGAGNPDFEFKIVR